MDRSQHRFNSTYDSDKNGLKKQTRTHAHTNLSNWKVHLIYVKSKCGDWNIFETCYSFHWTEFFYYLTTVSKQNAHKYVNAHILSYPQWKVQEKSERRSLYCNGLPFNRSLALQCVLGEFGRMDIFNRGSYSSMHDDAWIYNSLDAPVELSCASIHLHIRSQNKFFQRRTRLTHVKSWIWSGGRFWHFTSSIVIPLHENKGCLRHAHVMQC